MSEQTPQFVRDDPKLASALEQVRTNHDEAVKFALDPESYLQSKGVDTEGLTMRSELSDAELEQVAGGQMTSTAPGIGICGSVGCVGCITVGDDV